MRNIFFFYKKHFDNFVTSIIIHNAYQKVNINMKGETACFRTILNMFPNIYSLIKELFFNIPHYINLFLLYFQKANLYLCGELYSAKL